jgi:hypothetical protein
MGFEIIVILIISLLLSSSISSAVAYWKRNALFGTNIGEACDKDTDNIGCKLPLKCEQSMCRAPKNTACKVNKNCQSPLVCDANSMKCQPAAAVTSTSTTEDIDCQGAWDTEWSTCASDTSGTCGVKGSQTKQFTVSRPASGSGTACTNDREKSRVCDLPTCESTANASTPQPVAVVVPQVARPPQATPHQWKKASNVSCTASSQCQSNNCRRRGRGARKCE